MNGDQLAYLTAWHFAHLAIDNAELRTRQRRADGMQLVRKVVGVQHAANATFGHVARPLVQQPALEIGRQQRLMTDGIVNLNIESVGKRQLVMRRRAPAKA